MQGVEYGLPKKTEMSTYDRFTSRQKRIILALVSLAGMIPCKSLFHIFPWLTGSFLSGTLNSVCNWLIRAMYTTNISRLTNDRDSHQASYPLLLLPNLS
jgi:hypothetical protein